MNNFKKGKDLKDEFIKQTFDLIDKDILHISNIVLVKKIIYISGQEKEYVQKVNDKICDFTEHLIDDYSMDFKMKLNDSIIEVIGFSYY
jgi:hypothetical protein